MGIKFHVKFETAQERDELFAWCEEQFGPFTKWPGEGRVVLLYHTGLLWADFLFEQDRDATIFKMWWA